MSAALSVALSISLAAPAVVAPVVAAPRPTGDATSRYTALAERGRGVAPQIARSTRAGTRVLVRWAPGVPENQIAAAETRLGFEVVAADEAIDSVLVRSRDDRMNPQALADLLLSSRLATSARVENVYSVAAVRPNDPMFRSQYALENTGQTGGTPGADISATLAWERGTGSKDIVVAVVDTGIDIEHEDLAPNIWTNDDEIPGNGVDDDRNGYVDDVNGWDFSMNDATVFDAADGDQHGTHVAGIIGAAGDNGLGISGVNQRVTIMPVKFLGPWGGGEYEGARAIRYAVDNGADVINCSWGGGPSDVIGDALDHAADRGVLVVCAAGNDGVDLDAFDDFGFFPGSYDSTAVLNVAATDDKDALADFSNYGSRNVDVAAPGVDVLSTLPYETVALLVDKMPYRIAYLAFAPEAIAPAETGRQAIARSLAELTKVKDDPILLVDDSMPSLTKEAAGVRRAFYAAALTAAGYTNVRTWFTQTQGAPKASDLAGNVVVWFTGSTAGGWYPEPCVTDAERAALGAYLDGGGRLLMASGEIGSDLGMWGDPEWFAKYFHARTVMYETWGYQLRGNAGTIFAGLTGDLGQAYRWPDGYETQLWPTGSDSVVPADGYATPLAGMGGYGELSGTSMASPVVAGSAALLMSQGVGDGAEDVRLRLENTVDELATLRSFVGYEGRIDADAAAGTYLGRPTSLEPTAGVRPLRAGSAQAVSWRMPRGASPEATFEIQQGLPVTAFDEGFEAGTVPVRFTTPTGAQPWYVTTDPALVHSGARAVRSASMRPSGSVEVIEEITDDWGGMILWSVSGAESSTLDAKVTVPDGGGTLSFWWRMDALDPWGDFSVDGESRAWMWPLPLPYRRVQVKLSPGEHTLRWSVYKLFGDFTYGNDCLALDDVKLVVNEFSPAATAPAGARSATWTVPVADAADAALRVRSRTATKTSPWAYSKGLRISSDIVGPPAPLTVTAGAGSDGQVRLSWANPAVPDFDLVRIVRRIGAPPTGSDDPSATVVYEGGASTFTDTGLVHGDDVHYALFACDVAGNLSAPARARATAADTTAPRKPIGVRAALEDGFVGLSWLSSESTRTVAARVVRLTGPGGSIDDAGARSVFDGRATHVFDYELSRVATQTTAHFAIQLYDMSGNRSQVATVSIVVDTRGPRGSITAAYGAESVTETRVPVACDVIRSAEMRFNGGAGWSAWVPYASSAEVTLTPREGMRLVRGQFRDENGLVREFTDQVYLNLAPPPAPSNLVAAGALGKVRLTWDAVQAGDVKGYHVYRSDGPTGPWRRIASVNAPVQGEEVPPQPGMPGAPGMPGMPPAVVETPTVSYLTPDLPGGRTFHFAVAAVDRDELVGTRSPVIAARSGSPVVRIAGRDAIATAVRASRDAFTAVDTVVVARTDRPLDQLCAVGLAGSHRSPVLLSAPGGLRADTVAEIRRLGATEVLFVGGSDTQASRAHAALGGDVAVKPVSGGDAYETAAAVAREMASAEATLSDVAFVVNSARRADAAAVLSAAYAMHAPVLYVRHASVPAATRDVVDELDFELLRVIGGEDSVSEDALATSVSWVPRERLEGASAFEIAAMQTQMTASSKVATFGAVGVVNPARPAETAAGAAAAGSRGGVVVLTTASGPPAESRALLRANAPSIGSLRVYGGTPTLSALGFRRLRSALDWRPDPWGEPGAPPGGVR